MEQPSQHVTADDGPSLGHFFISLPTMERPLRLLTGVALAQVVAAVLVLALRSSTASGPDIGLGLQIPWLNYTFACASMAAALWLVSAGAMKATALGQLSFYAALALVYSLGITLFFTEDAPGKIAEVMTCFMLTYLAVALPHSYQKRYSPERQKPWLLWTLVALTVLPFAVLIFANPGAVATLLILLRGPVVYLFLLAGVDWAEIDDSLMRAILSRTPLHASPDAAFYAAFTASAALAILMGIESGAAGLYFLLPATLAAIVLGLVLLPARLSYCPFHFSWGGMALTVIAFGMLMDCDAKMNWQPSLLAPISFGAVAALGLVLARSRTYLDKFRPVLLFALVLAATWTVFGTPLAQYRMAANGLFFFLGAASSVLLGWIRWKLWTAPNLRAILRSILLLNLGCLGLYFVYAVLYVKAHQAAEDRVTLDAGVVLVAIVWDVLTSGHGITNIDGKWFPRRSRIYLFFGYVMTIVAIVLFFGSLNGQEGPALTLARLYADPEQFVQLGALLYGPAMLLTLFILRLSRLSQTAALPAGPPRDPALQPSPVGRVE